MSSMAVNDDGKVAEDPGSRKPSCYECRNQPTCAYWRRLNGPDSVSFPPSNEVAKLERWYRTMPRLLAACCDWWEWESR